MSRDRKKVHRSGNPAVRAWQPMEQGEVNPLLVAVLGAAPEVAVEAWQNDRYQAIVRRYPSGLVHLSVKRHDRAAVRDWRHLQAIKNEICGPEVEAVELYPAESRLADTANEFHLWALPAGDRFPFGFDDGHPVFDTQAGADVHNANQQATLGVRGKARQRAWEPGLPTGPGLQSEVPA